GPSGGRAGSVRQWGHAPRPRRDAPPPDPDRAVAARRPPGRRLRRCRGAPGAGRARDGVARLPVRLRHDRPARARGRARVVARRHPPGRGCRRRRGGRSDRLGAVVRRTGPAHGPGGPLPGRAVALPGVPAGALL
ncbi:MAG: hypothetical protein AVDCRST_MAG57-3442, partial [uncultured Blastococcus sp.]